MRFDVPVVGLPTVESMKMAGATALAIDANRTLLFDREKLIATANDAGIAIQAFPFAQLAEPTGDSRGMNRE
jgi:UDP-2,3-diacylglucosamine hydrolase